ncbi:DB module [Dirofilaria immitis]|nr:DB module [Dirofilaria immitis]
MISIYCTYREMPKVKMDVKQAEKAPIILESAITIKNFLIVKILAIKSNGSIVDAASFVFLAHLLHEVQMMQMNVTLVLLSVTILIHIGNIGADLPSCERARCHHCRVTFIAKMCPETCRPCFKKIAAPERYPPMFVNDTSNVFQRVQRPQARTTNIQQLLPQHQPQSASYSAKHNLYHHSPILTQELPFHYQYLSQHSQSGIQLPLIRQFPTASPPSISNQQTALIDPAFATFPSLLTFTFPTLPPFTFPAVTFAPPIYRTASQTSSNQFPAQIPPSKKFDVVPATQTHLFQPQRQRIEVFIPEQTVVPYATIGSQPQVYLQPQQQQIQLTPYTVQQQAVPVYPASRQPIYPSAQQLQPQQQAAYLKIQQQQQKPQYHFYRTNQQAALAIRPLPQSQLAPKIERPTLLSSQEYNIDAPISYIKGTYYKTDRKQHSAIAQELGQGCAALCNYDATLTTIQLAVLTGRCPLNKVGNVMICASGYQDATSCCEAYNVFEPGYEHCRPYCNPAAGLPQGVLLSEQYKCLGKLSQIQRCFYVSQWP